MTTETATIDIRKYNGKVTVYNPETGQHRTFRISTARKGGLAGQRIVSLLTGADNQSSYTGFGILLPDGRIRVWRKHQGTVFEKLAAILANSEWYAEHRGLEYSMAIRCRKCNKELTDPTSIELGIGPICRESE